MLVFRDCYLQTRRYLEIGHARVGLCFCFVFVFVIFKKGLGFKFSDSSKDGTQVPVL